MNWNKRRMGRMKEVPDACNSSSHWNQRLKSPNGCPHRCRRRQVLWRTWKLRRATGEPLRWGRGRRRRRRWGWRRRERGESSPLTWKRRRRRGVGWNVGWGTRGEGKSDYYSLNIHVDVVVVCWGKRRSSVSLDGSLLVTLTTYNYHFANFSLLPFSLLAPHSLFFSFLT